MKKFLLFMLLFVNLQIVVTKCGVEIGIQSAMAQDSGKESSIVGKYSCEAIDEMGYPMIVYTDLPCQYLDDRKCSNCGRLFSTLGERKTHEASCGSQQDDKEKKKKEEEAEKEKDLEDLIKGMDKVGIGAGTIEEFLNRYGLDYADLTKAVQKYCKQVGGITAGANILYQGYLGYKQDQAEGNGTLWNMAEGAAGGAGAWILGDLGMKGGIVIGDVLGGPGWSIAFGIGGEVLGSEVGDYLGRELVKYIREETEQK